VIAIRGGTVLTPEKSIDDGIVLIDAGKIVDVGANVEVPGDAEVIDASGQVVMPGMIDAHCHTGVFADGVGWLHADGNEMTDPITPHLRATDAIHPEDLAFKDLREAGVTTINTGPGSGNLIGGQSAAVKTYGRTVDEMLVAFPLGMKMALGENPKRVYGEQKKTPSTRMGNAATLREWLTKAHGYIERGARHEKKLADFHAGVEGATEPEPFEVDLKLEALARVLRREIPAHIHAHRADDIMTAIRIAEEFDLDLVLIHATEGYKIADILAKKMIPCVPGPILFSRAKVELREMTPKNAGILANAGVKVAIQTDQMSAVRYLRLDAAVAVNEGMSEDDALRAITLTPAEILGIDDRVGSLEVGKDADVVILSAHPLDVARGRVQRVLIGGETVFHRE
jgi:imidazolonepropionase-like amidohydrolase